MSKVSEALLFSSEWGISFFRTQKEMKNIVQEDKRTPFGNRTHLNNVGKSISEIKWRIKPKRFSSPSTQVELYFNWLNLVSDERTRRIIAASLIDYYIPVSDEEYEKLKKKKDIEFKYISTFALHFDLRKMPKERNSLCYDAEMEEMTDEPFITYKQWVEEGTEEQKFFALTYGRIEEVKIPLVKRKSMSHRFYTLSRAKKYISKDFSDLHDSYLNTSMTYQIPSKKDFRRLAERVTEYCLLFAELDYYKIDKYKDKTQKEMLKLIYKELDKQGFPHPTEVIFPRGLHLVWKISPIAAYRSFEWELMQKKIHSILEPFGADKQTVTDKVRLLRIVGSVHSKTGKKVWGHSFTDDRYLFDELINTFYPGEVEREKERRRKNREKYLKKQEQKFEVLKGGLSQYLKGERKEKKDENYTSNYVGNIIHEKYRRDLIKLIDLRHGKMNGYREFCCFLIRYWTLCITDGKSVKAINETEKLYYSMEIEGDYSLQDIISYTSSAESAFKKWKVNWTKGYNYRNDTLVNFLNITKEEQKQMWILIDDEETKRRDAERHKEKRKENGAVGHNEKRELIVKIIKENPSLSNVQITKQVTEILGKCSRNTVIAVRKELYI